MTLEVDFDGSLRGHTGSESIRRELTSVVNGEIRSSELGEFLLRRSDEHCRRRVSSVGRLVDLRE